VRCIPGHRDLVSIHREIAPRALLQAGIVSIQRTSEVVQQVIVPFPDRPSLLYIVHRVGTLADDRCTHDQLRVDGRPVSDTRFRTRHGTLWIFECDNWVDGVSLLQLQGPILKQTYLKDH